MGNDDSGDGLATTREKEIHAARLHEAQEHNGPIRLDPYDPAWPALYAREEQRIRRVLGGRVLRIEHTGSTSVPGLSAKPRIDITLAVADSADEAAYVPDLEAAGYSLVIREAAWFEHRVLKGPDTDVNLHVFSAAAAEIERMVRFRDWLRSHDDDRRRYEERKRELARRTWKYVQQYADAKSEVIADILARAEAEAAGAGPTPLLDPSYPIRTARLLLRPFEPGDLDALHDLFGREDVSRYLDWEPLSREQAVKRLDKRMTQTRITGEGQPIALAVEEAASGRVIGEVVLGLTSLAHRQGLIGWSIHPDAQGRGYATEAAAELLRLGFEGLGLHRIVADADPRNEPSIRVMDKLGMRREAVHIDAMWIKGEWVGAHVAAILEDEWRARQERPSPTRPSAG